MGLLHVIAAVLCLVAIHAHTDIEIQPEDAALRGVHARARSLLKDSEHDGSHHNYMNDQRRDQPTSMKQELRFKDRRDLWQGEGPESEAAEINLPLDSYCGYSEVDGFDYGCCDPISDPFTGALATCALVDDDGNMAGVCMDFTSCQTAAGYANCGPNSKPDICGNRPSSVIVVDTWDRRQDNRHNDRRDQQRVGYSSKDRQQSDRRDDDAFFPEEAYLQAGYLCGVSSRDRTDYGCCDPLVDLSTGDSLTCARPDSRYYEPGVCMPFNDCLVAGYESCGADAAPSPCGGEPPALLVSSDRQKDKDARVRDWRRDETSRRDRQQRDRRDADALSPEGAYLQAGYLCGVSSRDRTDYGCCDPLVDLSTGDSLTCARPDSHFYEPGVCMPFNDCLVAGYESCGADAAPSPCGGEPPALLVSSDRQKDNDARVSDWRRDATSRRDSRRAPCGVCGDQKTRDWGRGR